MPNPSLFHSRLPPFRPCVRLGFVIAMTLMSVASQIAAEDWEILFDGTGLDGWKPSRENTQFEVIDRVIVGSSCGSTNFLQTVKEYADFELELEIKIDDIDLNSGVQIRTRLTRQNDKGKSRPSINGPQVDLGKSPGRSGHIFGQVMNGWITPKEELSNHSLMVNGDWNRVRVLAQGPRIQTWINGQQVSDVVDATIHQEYSSGVIALQVHGVKKSPEKIRHASFRNIRVRETGLLVGSTTDERKQKKAK